MSDDFQNGGVAVVEESEVTQILDLRLTAVKQLHSLLRLRNQFASKALA